MQLLAVSGQNGAHNFVAAEQHTGPMGQRAHTTQHAQGRAWPHIARQLGVSTSEQLTKQRKEEALETIRRLRLLVPEPSAGIPD